MIRHYGILIVIAMLLAACTKDETFQPSSKVVKIGVLVSLSGPYKRLGHQSLIGMKAARELEPYLRNGDEIVYEIIDTKSKIANAKEALDQLARQDVRMIVSLLSSNEMVAMQSDFKRHKVPVVATLATDDTIASTEGYVSQVCMDNFTQVLVASHFIRDEKLMKSVGIVYDKRSTYSRSLAEAFKKYFVTLGGTVEFFLDVSTPHALEVFKKSKTETIEMLFSPVDAVINSKILKIREQQKKGFSVLGTDGLLSDVLELKQDNLNLFEGVYVVDHYTHTYMKNENRIQLDKILQKEGFEESSYAYLAYDGFQLLRHALQMCDEYESECINSIVHNSDVVQGAFNNFSMVNAKAKREVYIDRIHNGSLHQEVVVY